MEYLETIIYKVILRTYFYLEETGRPDSFARFPYLRVLTERLTEEAAKDIQQNTGIQAVRYRQVLSAIGDSKREDGVLSTALDLCLAVLQVPEFAAYLNYYTGNMVTIQLAYELEGIAYPAYGDVFQRLKQIGKVCHVDWKKVPLSYAAIEGSNRLLAYLMGENTTAAAFLEKAEWFLKERELHPMFIRGELAKECAEYLKRNYSQQKAEKIQKQSLKEDICRGVILQISGSGGRRFLAKHVARQLDEDLLLVDAAEFGDFQEDVVQQLQEEFVHEAFLRGGMVCIYGITGELLNAMQRKEADFLKKIVLPFLVTEIKVILCTGAEVHFAGNGAFRVHCVELKEITRAEREAVFGGFADLYGFSMDCAQYSLRYRLSASEIAKAVEVWRSTGGKEREERRKTTGKKNVLQVQQGTEGVGTAGRFSRKGKVRSEIEEMQFSRICYEIVCSGQEKPLGKVLYPSVGLSDLKVSDFFKETLGQICCSALEGYRIYEEWNLKSQYPYGRAVTVLLAGPPGTGKTMTAHVLAKELSIPLYQVDLSHIMDKYIGETEKHLEQVFAYAEKTNMILFFDEADSLFGKRGEVTEGKDRYANMEVSYILQRIEQFEGIVVLATNFYNNIDKAFLRRMKYVLKYELPDAKLRRSIWESCLPPELPGEELDLDYLAERFEFTGGMIKNVVLNACVRAVYEDRRLDMEHILRAVRAEYEKMEWTAAKDIWGEYGYLL